MFNNEDHDGQMLLSLDADAVRLYCKGDIQYEGKNAVCSHDLVIFFPLV